MKKTISAGLGVCAIALAFAAKDPVIMTVNGVDVPKSEFEYLYNKNSQQQINPQTLDEYVEMFKLYKMKVADAKAEGIDTIASFLKETEQYRHDLAAPYLADSVFINNLVAEAYDRSKEEVEAYHIMFFKTRNAIQNSVIRQKADSVLGCLKNGADFAEMAAKYSQDRGSNAKGGRMGWIVAGNFPLAFELEAFRLPEGQLSEIVESPVGYHILKGGKHRPARGKVNVAHILKVTKDKDAETQAKAKNDIDSIYQLVSKQPKIFGITAMNASEDPGSARQGGKLPLFGAGEMVEEFDSVAFSLKDGEISTPFRTAYGWHIIQRINAEPIPSMNAMKSQTVARMSSPQDPRYKLIRANQTAKLAKKHKSSLNDKTLASLRSQVGTQGLDSAMFVSWKSSQMPLWTIDGKTTKVADIVSEFGSMRLPASETANEIFNEQIDRLYNSALVNAEENSLLATEPDYANLLREYIDGSLLYEVSVRKVWDKAAKDTEGLERFFQKNRDNYKWTEPHAKGFLVQAVNDSIAALVRQRATETAPDSLLQVIRKEFKGNASIDKVLVSQGTNAMVDNILFGGPEVSPANNKFKLYFMINPRLITEPEEVGDVKGLVTSDYQNEFQAAWENELRKKYPVKVNEKVLRQVNAKK